MGNCIMGGYLRDNCPGSNCPGGNCSRTVYKLHGHSRVTIFCDVLK